MWCAQLRASKSTRAETAQAMTNHLWLSTFYFLNTRHETNLETTVIGKGFGKPNVSAQMLVGDTKHDIQVSKDSRGEPNCVNQNP